MKAIGNNQVIAESNDIIMAENNHYLPEYNEKAEFLNYQPPAYTLKIFN